MKRSLTHILLAIFMVALMGGCNEKSITQEVDFSKIEKLSIITPDEKEIFLNDSDKKRVTDILSKAESSTETEDFDGGIRLQAYSGDKIKWNITVYDANHISAGTDSDVMYKISESDYKMIDDIYVKSVDKK
ncbi:MAG: hypothetical protein ACI4HZ_03060 [Ruminococcus sp.]